MSTTIEGREYTHAFFADCTACGGRMLETFVSVGAEKRTIGFECADCVVETRFKHRLDDGIDNPSYAEGVTNVRGGWVRWIDCWQCQGRGRVPAALDDLQRTGRQQETCPRCRGSGTVRDDYIDTAREAATHE